MTAPGHRFRVAEAVDAPAVRELDNAAFGPGSQRAEPGELEAGVLAGDIHVLVQDDVPVGYLHADTSRANRIYVAGVAVRPDRQGCGLGSALIDHMLELLGDERHLTPVVTVTSPMNVRMLRILFRRGFSARWFLLDHFGPGYHRFGCQLLAGTAASADAHAAWVPATQFDRVRELMHAGSRIRSIDGGRPASSYFELVPTRPGDFLAADPPNRFVDPVEYRLDGLGGAVRDNVETSYYNDGMWG